NLHQKSPDFWGEIGVRDKRRQNCQRRRNVSQQLDCWSVGVIEVGRKHIDMDDRSLLGLIPHFRFGFDWVVANRDQEVGSSKEFVRWLVCDYSNSAGEIIEKRSRDGSRRLKCSDYRKLCTLDQFTDGRSILRPTRQ